VHRRRALDVVVVKFLKRWLETRRPVADLMSARVRLQKVMADIKPVRYRQGWERPDGKVRL
jgi:hypothetical protein